LLRVARSEDTRSHDDEKKPDLDDATIRVMKQMLASPPKRHSEMKVGRPVIKKRRGPKDRAASSKQRTRSKTDRGS
jgi:hypothetical protein